MRVLKKETVTIQNQWDLGKEPNKVPKKVNTKRGQQEKMV